MLARCVGPIGLAVSVLMLLAARFSVVHVKFIEFGAALALALSVAAIYPNTRFSCTPFIKRCSEITLVLYAMHLPVAMFSEHCSNGSVGREKLWSQDRPPIRHLCLRQPFASALPTYLIAGCATSQ